MFNEVISNTYKFQDYFMENVQAGQFAQAFPTEVIDKILEEEHTLQRVYDDAQDKIMQINQLTNELRAMI